MINKVMSALAEKNIELLISCFTENCMYFDYCPSQNGEENFFIYGNTCLEMLLRSKLSSGEIVVSDPIVESENCANFFGAYKGPYIFARLEIEEYDSSGFIKKAVVHPA